jgi:hypothetical protein
MEPEFSKQADWLSFALHFIFGLVVGFFVGLAAISRRGQSFCITEEFILPYLIGASLIGAGLGAKMGDRLWVGDHYRIIPPSGPSHSRVSYYSAISTLVFGIAMVVFCIVLHSMK